MKNDSIYIRYKYDWLDDGIEYDTYLEILNDTAVRQVLELKNKTIGSNRYDEDFDFFLAEGPIDLEELEHVELIDDVLFNKVWKKHCKAFIKDWKSSKRRYKINDIINGTIKVIYPQGVIILIDHHTLGIVDYDDLCNQIGSNQIYPNIKIKAKVSGYDEENMWIMLSSC